VAELGGGAGDAERARVGVPVLLRGGAEERREGRLWCTKRTRIIIWII